jgi:hypothetical protein
VAACAAVAPELSNITPNSIQGFSSLASIAYPGTLPATFMYVINVVQLRKRDPLNLPVTNNDIGAEISFNAKLLSNCIMAPRESPLTVN